MTNPIAMSLPSGIEPVYMVAVGGLLALALAGWSIRRNRNRADGKRVGTPAVWVSALAALNCTIYSGDTSWRFAADYLDMAGTVERAMMFSAGEAALFATALMARQNLKTTGAPGLPGALVWVITGVQVIPAYAESGSIGGTVRAFVGPVMAAVLWHLAMGIELRLHKPDATSHGLLATLGREARERLLSRLGIATRNRDAAQITKDRATRRAVALAARLSAMSPSDREKDTRITRRLQSALTRAGVGTDPQQRQALLEQLAARRYAVALATVDLPSPWVQDADREERSPLVPSPVPPPVGEEQAGRRRSTVPNDGAQVHRDGDRTEAGTGTETEGDRPHTVPDPDGDGEHPETETETGTGTGTGTGGYRPHAVPNTDADRVHERGSSLLSEGTAATIGDRDAVLARGEEADADGDGSAVEAHESGAQGGTGPFPAAVPSGDEGRGHPDTEAGTEGEGDRPHTVPEAGTETDEDRPHTVPKTGTETQESRPHTVPGRRTTKAQRNRPGSGKPKRPQQKKLSTAQLVKIVRPHVAAKLERDGNASINRPQLREIYRDLGLPGGRNESLTPVLERLRAHEKRTTR
ncbi:hypothetical protein QNN03_05050 [Streptomyces sp. GXMU-J15]|uniref:DUF2637 domain-containing protein n=1 Tax=Streptomyces fuscus TaxID=3048495 RepID=A0ABT7IT87_9ACTN|nr:MULTISPECIES: hypothetical protein [Streptomyces]MDL2075800.1 hypothetical protein [Streptomyces fuscus]SBT93327.1 hypothetical protein GA0115233_10625 [Streptomyces sp. DI166]